MYGLVFTDPNGTRVFEVPVVDRPLTVGRAQDVDIALPFKAVSRYHARFYADQTGLYVEDLGSSNGVLVGGSRISGPTQLQPGLQIPVRFRSVPAEELSAAVQGVLGDPSYAARARRVGEALRRLGGAERAAAAIESLVVGV